MTPDVPTAGAPPGLTPSATPPLAPVPESQQALNWEVHLRTAPPRPTGNVCVRLLPGGRSRPRPVADPDLPDEDNA